MKTTKTTYKCDIAHCHQEIVSGHGLPKGWYAVAHAVDTGKTLPSHYCSHECLIRAGVKCRRAGEVSG